MPGSRLDDKRLDDINRAPWQDLDDVTNGEIVAMAAELKERRAMDLTSDDVEVLAAMLRDIGSSDHFMWHAWHDKGLTLLAKLLASEGGS